MQPHTNCPPLYRIYHEMAIWCFAAFTQLKFNIDQRQMAEVERYRKLVEYLQAETLPGGHIRSSAFFFKTLQRLDGDTIVSESEVAEKQKQIAALEERIQLIRESQRQYEAEQKKANQSSSEQIVKDFACLQKDCQKRFEKDSGLRLHTLLMHTPNMKWKENLIFKIEVDDAER